jgi:hypothetical protein
MGKEFTEKWLQALSMSASQPAAQRIKPLFNDIDSICMQRDEPEQVEAAGRLWEFAGTVALRPLLSVTPFQFGEWRFEDDEEEAFVFEQPESDQTGSLDHWINALGLRSHQVPMVAIVNQEDWSQILRDEAIRLGRPLKVTGSAPSKESLLWLSCNAEWDRTGWTFHFADPSWISKKFEAGFVVSRPEWNTIEDKILESVAFAIKNLSNGTSKIPNPQPHEPAWVASVPRLVAMHRKVLTQLASTPPPSPWFYRVWSCVWPVVYREQNRLQGACDIDWVRRELEICFLNVPQLTIWTFAIGKIICQHQLGRGLGVSGEFK